MKQMSYTIKDPDGIHARPAGLLVKKLQSFPCSVTIEKGEKSADGKKLFAVMKLGVKKDETINFTFDGENEDEALAATVEVLKETGL
ncbi:MAG: HPr family phosphocarrier protein [Deltaproteobacteria bacterium]|jgi:phosphocarrier protein|nr:HPr family phosphocarrier protein [Deltaproteobacteria bacterium]